MPWLALIFAGLAFAPGAARAQAPGETTPPSPAPPGPEAEPPLPPPAATPAPARAQDPFDEDFEDRTIPSIAFGPVPQGDIILSADVGWIRSGLRADLGITSWLNLVMRADTLLLYEQFGGASSINVGARISPVSSGLFRVSIDLSIGQVFVPGDIVVENMTAIGGEATAGVALPWFLVYTRVGMRGLSPGSSDAGWTRESEFGGGVERAYHRLIVGAEGFVWSRPSLSGLGQWRLRVGYAF